MLLSDFVLKHMQDGTNHVFYSNRSAAYLSWGRVEEAIADAKKCVEVDPKFSKGYGRLGAALFAAGKHGEAAAAYASGIAVDPTNASFTEGLVQAQQAAAKAAAPKPIPDADALAAKLAQMSTNSNSSSSSSSSSNSSTATPSPKAAGSDVIIGIDLGTTYS